jgi:hypothetical protein
MLGIVNDRVVYATIPFRSSASTELPNGRSHPLFDLLTDLKSRLAARAPAQIGSFYFTDLLSPVGGFTWYVPQSHAGLLHLLQTINFWCFNDSAHRFDRCSCNAADPYECY